MAAPVASKTWQVAPNLRVPGYGAEHTVARVMMLLFKDTVTGFALNPWTIAGMSDGVTGAMDATDRWAVYTDLQWGTGAHSWVVFNHPTGAQILFDQKYVTTTCELNFIAWSPGGLYTGGDETTAPTASDERTRDPTGGCVVQDNGISNLAVWNGNMSHTSFDHLDTVHHIWHSTDGLVTYWAIFAGGICPAFWQFGELAEPRAAHTTPFCIGGIVNSSASGSINDMLGNATYLLDRHHICTCKTVADGRSILALFGDGNTASFVWTGSIAGDTAEEWDGELNVTDVLFFGIYTGSRGPKGKMCDVFWSQYQVLSKGDTFPANAAQRDWVHLGAFCLPWTGDATVPLIA